MDSSLTVRDAVEQDITTLESFVRYGLDQYAKETGVENTYSVDFERDYLNGGGILYFEECDYCFDLAKEINPSLVNAKYVFQIDQNPVPLLVVIDTRRMKVLCYEMCGKISIEPFDLDVWDEDEEEEKCVVSDWDDIPQEELFPHLNEWTENMDIPQDYPGSTPILYELVIYATYRYCHENDISEKFYFDINDDIVSTVSPFIKTVLVHNDQTQLYMDLDLERRRIHVYRVEE